MARPTREKLHEWNNALIIARDALLQRANEWDEQAALLTTGKHRAVAMANEERNKAAQFERLRIERVLPLMA